MTTISRARALPGPIGREMPFERFALRVLGQTMTYVDDGPRDGKAVVLVHGNPTWSFVWRKVMRELAADGLRLIAPDLLGFGGSDKPRRPSDHRLSAHIESVELLLRELGVERFVAVGQDWGGPIVTGAAARLHDRMSGLVLANTSVLAPARPFRSTSFHRFARVPLLSDVVFRGALFPVPVMDRVQGDRSSIGWRQKAAYAWPFLHPLDRAGPLGLARMVPSTEEHPSTPILDTIGAWVSAWRGPAALVWGRRDPILGRALRRHTVALPQATVRECDAGHFLQEEAPVLVAEAIREVLGLSGARA